MKKKKILFTAYNLNIGGIEKSLINLLNNMNYNKYDITLILEHKEGILLKQLNKNIKVQEYKVSTNNNTIIRKIINITKRIKWLLSNYQKYDFSCCYATYSYPGNVLAYYGSKNNSIYIHSNYKYVYNEKELRNFFDTRRINKWRHIIFVSTESMNDLEINYPFIKEKGIVINNLINTQEIIELSKEKIDLEKKKDKLLVFVGRLDEKSKKITKLIKVMEKLHNVELWIIGDGPDLELYQQMTKNINNIKLLGQKMNPYPYMKKADYIILTSDYEGFPVVYNEAIILNKKIITTIDVSDDYIRIKDRFGYIIDKDMNKMTIEIDNIIKNDNLKTEKVDFTKINKERIKKIESIIDEEI